MWFHTFIFFCETPCIFVVTISQPSPASLTQNVTVSLTLAYREEGDEGSGAAPAAADSASEAANPDSGAVKKEPSAERNVLPDSTEDAVVAKPKVS